MGAPSFQVQQWLGAGNVQPSLMHIDMLGHCKCGWIAPHCMLLDIIRYHEIDDQSARPQTVVAKASDSVEMAAIPRHAIARQLAAKSQKTNPTKAGSPNSNPTD